jgi:hypothetical protein
MVLTIDHLLTIKKPLKYPFSRFQKAGETPNRNLIAKNTLIRLIDRTKK